MSVKVAYICNKPKKTIFASTSGFFDSYLKALTVDISHSSFIRGPGSKMTKSPNVICQSQLDLNAEKTKIA